MLYDRKWDQPAKAEAKPDAQPDVFSLAGLVAWLERQPAEETYSWPYPEQCLVYRYLEAQGIDPFGHGAPMFSVALGEGWPYFEIAEPNPWTYGAALQRAKALLPS